MQAKEFYEEGSIPRIIAKTAIPAVIAILVMIVYNIADVFFVAQMGDPMQIAAVSVAAPVMAILSGLGTLIGSGGCIAIASALGKKDQRTVKQMSSFCCWTSIGIGALFAISALIFMPTLLALIGTSPNTLHFARQYLQIIVYGAPMVLFASTTSNIIRAEGAVKTAMYGNILGSIVNIVLDPLFIFVFKMGVQGAAYATLVGNLCAAIYYLLHYRGSLLTLHWKYYTLKKAVSWRIILLGMPTAIGVLLMSFSSVFRNNLVAQYGDQYIAAMGVGGKVVMVIGMIQMGICMGVQPAMAYYYGAANNKRLIGMFNGTAIVSTACGAILSLAVFVFRTSLIKVFINNETIISLGDTIVKVCVLTGPYFGLFYLCTSFLQATNQPGKAIAVSLLRQGVILLPLMLLLNHYFGFLGILWTQPITDTVATFTAFLLAMQGYMKIRTGALVGQELETI